MQRRTLFRLGIAGTVILVLGGGIASLTKPGLSSSKLTTSGRDMFAALAAAILADAIPSEPALKSSALVAYLDRVDGTIHGLSEHIQSELSQLLGLLGNPLARKAILGLAGDWQSMNPLELQTALDSMRTSTSDIKQQTYAALRSITVGAWFSDASTWKQIGYPGPIPI